MGHDVKTAHQMSWASIKNGELLALAAEHFDVFVTVDRNLSFQQRLTELPAVGDLLGEHITLAVECVDRPDLNGQVPRPRARPWLPAAIIRRRHLRRQP